jgi:hypothetical protein
MAIEHYTPTERLIRLSLQLHPGQTPEELHQSTSVKTLKHLLCALRTLRMAGVIVAETCTDASVRYSPQGGCQ